VNRVTVTLKGGERYVLRGYESQITEQINQARGTGKLLRLELDRIPTGQMVAIDPDDVTSVKGDQW
jgi:hypothetical protein